MLAPPLSPSTACRVSRSLCYHPLVGIGSAKVVAAFTLVFFILLVNTLGGAKNVDNDILTIARPMVL